MLEDAGGVKLGCVEREALKKRIGLRMWSKLSSEQKKTYMDAVGEQPTSRSSPRTEGLHGIGRNSKKGRAHPGPQNF